MTQRSAGADSLNVGFCRAVSDIVLAAESFAARLSVVLEPAGLEARQDTVQFDGAGSRCGIVVTQEHQRLCFLDVKFLPVLQSLNTSRGNIVVREIQGLTKGAPLFLALDPDKPRSTDPLKLAMLKATIIANLPVVDCLNIGLYFRPWGAFIDAPRTSYDQVWGRISKSYENLMSCYFNTELSVSINDGGQCHPLDQQKIVPLRDLYRQRFQSSLGTVLKEWRRRLKQPVSPRT